MLVGRQVLKVKVKENLEGESNGEERRWYTSNEEHIVGTVLGDLKETHYQVMYGRHSLNLILKKDVDVLEQTNFSIY